MHACPVTIVIPVHNEAESVRLLASEIEALIGRTRFDIDVVFVDDGSTDATWHELRALACNAPFRAVRLVRRLGKSAALRAGLIRARGDVLITLDGDLQDDPADIPAFLVAIQGGVDMVVGWKRCRRDRITRIWMSRSFNLVIRLVTGVPLHDQNCGFKAFRREVRDRLWLSDGMHRFMPAMAAAAGFRVAELEVHHRPRRFGRSKYGLARVPRAAWDLARLLIRTGGLRRAAASELDAPRGEVAEEHPEQIR